MSQANTLPIEDLESIAARVSATSHKPLVDGVIFALSFRAGLRACEMAGVRWRDVLASTGDVVLPGKMWRVPDNVAKKNSGRPIPMHPDLYTALVRARAALPAAAVTPEKPLVLRSVPLTGVIDPRYVGVGANTLQRYISRRFKNIGLVGVTSHSGRRTFLTDLARRATQHNCSLRDVMKLAGHRQIETTERYVELSDGVGNLVVSA